MSKQVIQNLIYTNRIPNIIKSVITYLLRQYFDGKGCTLANPIDVYNLNETSSARKNNKSSVNKLFCLFLFTRKLKLSQLYLAMKAFYVHRSYCIYIFYVFLH